jgi:hypothetical protein
MLCQFFCGLCKKNGVAVFYVFLFCIVTGLFIVPVAVLALLLIDGILYVTALLLATFVKTGIQASRRARPVYSPPQAPAYQPPTRADIAQEVKREYDDKLRTAMTIPDQRERSMAMAQIENERRALLAQLLSE